MLVERKRQERIASVPNPLRLVAIAIVVVGGIAGTIAYYFFRDRSSTTKISVLFGSLSFIAGVVMYFLQQKKREG
jgi:uncharacterized membrane protein HdeD (DUF308 family)